MPEEQKDDMLKVDLEKGVSKQFEIRTMQDDLKEALSEVKAGAKSQASPKGEEAKRFETPSPSSPPSLKPEAPEFLLEEEGRGSWVKSFLIGFFVMVVLGLAGVGAWWYASNRPLAKEEPLIKEAIPPSPVIADTPLIPIDKSLTLELDENESRLGFFTKLAALVETSKQDFAPASVVRVVFTQGGKLLTLEGLEKTVNLDFPPSLSSQGFTFVFFVQEPSPTFGFVVPMEDANATKKYFSSLEGQAPALANELYNDFTRESLPQAASQTFLDNTYQGVTIRYINFDTPLRTFDYAFHDKVVLLAGSRGAMFALIDRVKLQSSLNETSEKGGENASQ